MDWVNKYYSNQAPQEEYRLLGKKITIIHQHHLFAEKHLFKFEKDVLKITSPSGSSLTTENLFKAYLRHYAKKYLIGRARELSSMHGFLVNNIIIRGQKTRWGSCSSRKNLSFNYKLMIFRKEIIDYVIIHELCHLKEMNHSKNFWRLVENYCPSYKTLRKELKNKN